MTSKAETPNPQRQAIEESPKEPVCAVVNNRQKGQRTRSNEAGRAADNPDDHVYAVIKKPEVPKRRFKEEVATKAEVSAEAGWEFAQAKTAGSREEDEDASSHVYAAVTKPKLTTGGLTEHYADLDSHFFVVPASSRRLEQKMADRLSRGLPARDIIYMTLRCAEEEDLYEEIGPQSR